MNTKPGSDLLYLQEQIGELKSYIENVIETYESIVEFRINSQNHRLCNHIATISEDIKQMIECGNEIKKLLRDLGKGEIVENEIERSYYDGDREMDLKNIIIHANSFKDCDLRSMKYTISSIKEYMHNFDYIMS